MVPVVFGDPPATTEAEQAVHGEGEAVGPPSIAEDLKVTAVVADDG